MAILTVFRPNTGFPEPILYLLSKCVVGMVDSVFPRFKHENDVITTQFKFEMCS